MLYIPKASLVLSDMYKLKASQFSICSLVGSKVSYLNAILNLIDSICV